MCYSPRNCKVCGGEITAWARFCYGSRYGYIPYCSTRCSLIGSAWYSFIGAILLSIASFVILIYVFAQGDVFYSNLMGYLIGFGVLAIILAFSSAIGFRLKRIDGY